MKRGRKATKVWVTCWYCSGTGRRAPKGSTAVGWGVGVRPLGFVGPPCTRCDAKGGSYKRHQLFLCIGGPLAHTEVTEKEAGPKYTRFNSTARGRCILVHDDELPAERPRRRLK